MLAFDSTFTQPRFSKTPVEDEVSAEDTEAEAGSRPQRRTGREILVIGILIIGAIGIVIGAIAVFGDDPEGPERQAERSRPERGVACPHLREASDALGEGDPERLRQAVNQAARAAERALETSGQAFGRPEEISLELALARKLTNTAARDRLLAQGLEACDQLAV